jgi:hypothetical protein
VLTSLIKLKIPLRFSALVRSNSLMWLKRNLSRLSAEKVP